MIQEQFKGFDILNPLIGLAFHRFSDLSKLAVTIGDSTISYGKFLSLLINFFILAAVVYFGIKRLSERLDRPKDQQVPPAPPVRK
jgi:large-conductance mechanosensitive channel